MPKSEQEGVVVIQSLLMSSADSEVKETADLLSFAPLQEGAADTHIFKATSGHFRTLISLIFIYRQFLPREKFCFINMKEEF